MPTTQLELLRRVMAWDPPVTIFGGFAEDALLHGRVTRPHEDIDVLVMRDELDLRLDQAAALGFTDWHLRFAVVRERPLVIGSIRDTLNLEFIVFDRDERGDVYWEMPTPEGLARLYLPDDALTWRSSRIEDVEVRTFSPRGLYHIRVGVTELFGGLRPKDRVAQAALRARFFQGVPEEALAPRVELAPEEARPVPAPGGRART